MKKALLMVLTVFMLSILVIACDCPEPVCNPIYVYETNDYYYTNNITNDPPVFEGYDMTFTTYIYGIDLTNGNPLYDGSSNRIRRLVFRYYTNDALIGTVLADPTVIHWTGPTNDWNTNVTLTLLGYYESIQQGIIEAGEQDKITLSVIVEMVPQLVWAATNYLTNSWDIKHIYPGEYGQLEFTNVVAFTNIQY